MENMTFKKWKNKNVLAIGDSITSDGRWQAEFARLTGCNIKTHAHGGIGIIDMTEGKEVADSPDFKYDPFTGTNGSFGPLSVEEVKGVDLIIFLGAYNERHMEYGERGDMFPENNTLRGKFAFRLSRTDSERAVVKAEQQRRADDYSNYRHKNGFTHLPRPLSFHRSGGVRYSGR